ncbi:hypothetical protein PR003_g32517, partial [Phytophthora rubi]
MVPWVQVVEVQKNGTRADHDAVRLHLSNPADPVRVRKPARVYPAPALAAEAVKEDMLQRLQEFHTQLQERDDGVVALAQEWDDFKVEVRKAALTITKQRRKAARATYKQRLRRLLRQETRLRESTAGTTPTIDYVTDAMDAMTLVDGRGGTPMARVRNANNECINGRAAVKQRRLFRESGHTTGKTTRPLFKRVSTKYGDSEIHQLHAANGQAARGVHDQPDTLADAWTPIFQQAASSPDARQRVLRWLGEAGQYRGVLQDLKEPFTEAEVAVAIGQTKA